MPQYARVRGLLLIAVSALAVVAPSFGVGTSAATPAPVVDAATPPCPFIVASSPATLSATPPYPMSPCPGVVMGTYFGGSLTDWANDVAVDAAGNTYVVGYTNSTDFPLTPGGLSPEDPADCGEDSIYDLCQDGFLLKLDSSGALAFSTLLGGSSYDEASSVAVDASGSIYVTGSTWSVDFPTTSGAFQPTHGGGLRDVFVMKFDSAGGLIYSTFLGGSGDERRSSISVDAFGSAYVGGITGSPDFPVTRGALRATDTGVFVVKLQSSGATLDYAAIVGEGSLIAQSTIDAEGSVYVTTVPLYLSDNAGDVLVYKLNARGSTLKYSTSFGGSRVERPAAIAVDGTGRAYVTGYTTSEDFPRTPGAYDTEMDLSWHEEAFLTVLDPRGRELVYSTFFGGVGDEFGNGVYVDGSGVVYFAGRKEFGSRSDTGGGFPTTQGAFDRTHNGGSDGFVAKVDLEGNLLYSTFLGGGDDVLLSEPTYVPYCNPCEDSIQALAIDPTGNATVVGGTASVDFPVTDGAFDVTYNGGSHDVFVLRVELIPEPNRAPVAYFKVRPSTEGRIVVNASGSADAEDVDGLLEVRWDWEDDGLWDTEWSTLKGAYHDYSKGGTYTIRLQVRDTGGLMSETTSDVSPPGMGWGLATLVETIAGDAHPPQIAMDPDGNAVVVWGQQNESRQRIWASRFAHGEGWSPATPISHEDDWGDYPRVAMDAAGNAIVVWSQSGPIYSSRFVPGEGWGTPTSLGCCGRVGLAMDPAGNAIAVWRQSGQSWQSGPIYASRFVPDEGWGGAIAISTGDNATWGPQIAMDAAGNAIVVWSQSGPIYSSRFVPGEGWGTPTSLGCCGGTGLVVDPQWLVMDPHGNAIVYWSGWWNRFVPGVGWGLLPEKIITGASFAWLAMGGDGTAIGVWVQAQGGGYRVWANRFVPGEGWGPATQISQKDEPGAVQWSLRAAMDTAGNAIAVWRQSDFTRYNLWANRFVPGEGWGTATLLEVDPRNAGSPDVAMDAAGNAIAVWEQWDGSHYNVWASRFVLATAPPTLSATAAAPDPVELGASVTISTQATDNSGVDHVNVEIRDSQANLVGNFTMTSRGAGLYEYAFSTTAIGTFTYRVVAEDNAGNAAVAGGSFVVQDTTPPVADAGPDQTVTQGTVVTFDGTGSSDLGGIATYMWTFNDKLPVTLTGPNPSHRFATPGTYLVTLTVTDPSGNSATDTVLVTVPPPLAPSRFPQEIAMSIVIIVAVAVAIAGSWIAWRRRRRG